MNPYHHAQDDQDHHHHVVEVRPGGHPKIVPRMMGKLGDTNNNALTVSASQQIYGPLRVRCDTSWRLVDYPGGDSHAMSPPHFSVLGLELKPLLRECAVGLDYRMAKGAAGLSLVYNVSRGEIMAGVRLL